MNKEALISRDMALEKMADYVASGYADSAEDFEEYSRIICQLPSVTHKSGWIPVSERVPQDHDWYLIVVKEKSTGYQYIPRVATYLHDNDWVIIDTEDANEEWLNDLVCVAWMPLPEPYEPQESEVQE